MVLFNKPTLLTPMLCGASWCLLRRSGYCLTLSGRENRRLEKRVIRLMAPKILSRLFSLAQYSTLHHTLPTHILLEGSTVYEIEITRINKIESNVQTLREISEFESLIQSHKTNRVFLRSNLLSSAQR